MEGIRNFPLEKTDRKIAFLRFFKIYKKAAQILLAQGKDAADGNALKKRKKRRIFLLSLFEKRFFFIKNRREALEKTTERDGRRKTKCR
jgi:hypothetical protein